ncbi:TPA: hypothetical protein R5S02_004516 [Salmonella enterica]|nr:hypothetical protein [Salmonella enterica]
MGLQATIDVEFLSDISPKEIVVGLMNNGWEFSFNERVTFLLPSDVDNYDWQDMDVTKFNIHKFLNSHEKRDKVGIVLVNDDAGGNFLIHPGWMSFSLSINRLYLPFGNKIVDFNCYLNKLHVFMGSVKISAIKCELIY